MNFKALALASVLGISTPMIADATLFTPAALAEIVYPEGLFKDNDWNVRLEHKNGIYTYFAQNVHSGNSLRLNVSEAGGSPERYTYTFRNGDYRYIIAYRPYDPDLIRLQAIDSQGRVTLNRLLTKASNPGLVYPQGYFKDEQWGVRLQYKNGQFTYFGEQFGTSNYLSLNRAEVSGNRQRYTYTFRNNGYQYVIAHRPDDPEIIRLQVIHPNGNTILNRLLTWVGDDYDV